MIIRFVVAFIICSFCVAPALHAQDAKQFAVLPFEILGPQKYAHLSAGIQSMLNSRLSWEGHYQPVDKASIKEKVNKLPTSKKQATQIKEKLGADYLIWGTVTILGDTCSIDVQSLKGENRSWTKGVQTKVAELIPSLETLSQDINQQVFARRVKSGQPVATAPAPRQQQPVQQSLNPQFKYQERTNQDAGGRWRSQSLPFVSRNMIMEDADNDGQNELFILQEKSIRAYRVQGPKLLPLATYEFPAETECINLSAIDIDRDKNMEIMVSSLRNNVSRSFALNFAGNKFTLLSDDINFFVNVIRKPPTFMRTLVGQQKTGGKLFVTDVYEVTYDGKEFQLRHPMSLPKAANVFNFNYLPQKDGYKLVLIDSSDNVRIYSETNQGQFTSMNVYNASPIGLQEGLYYYEGQGESMEGNEQYYYVPLRIVTGDLDKNGEFELILNHNVSLAAQFFSRYRFFNNGELHNLVWDGIALDLVWKSRRIQGSIVDYGVGDLDNDGSDELFICINTTPGLTGTAGVKTIVLAYDLNVSETKIMSQ